MAIDTLVYIGLGAMLALLFLMIYFKDIESNKKFERFEKTIEDLNQQNHQLRHALLHKDSDNKEISDELKSKLKKNIQEEISSRVVPLLDSLKEIETVIEEFKDEHQHRLNKLEERTKSMNMLSPNATISNEKQVVHAYKNGKGVHTIAKDLRIGVGEVEFILKMHNLT